MRKEDFKMSKLQWIALVLLLCIVAVPIYLQIQRIYYPDLPAYYSSLGPRKQMADIPYASSEELLQILMFDIASVILLFAVIPVGVIGVGVLWRGGQNEHEISKPPE